MPDFGRKGLQRAIPPLTNIVPELYPQPGNPPQGWSMGGMITIEADSTTGRRENTICWCGMNIFWWLDSESGIAGILASQILPFWGECKYTCIIDSMLIKRSDDQVRKLREKVEKAVYNSLK
jgi:hypothetical protein